MPNLRQTPLPQPPTVPQRKGHPLGNFVKADEVSRRPRPGLGGCSTAMHGTAPGLCDSGWLRAGRRAVQTRTVTVFPEGRCESDVQVGLHEPFLSRQTNPRGSLQATKSMRAIDVTCVSVSDALRTPLRVATEAPTDRAGIFCSRYCCLPNLGRCVRSQDRVSGKCPLVERIYPAEWMAEKQHGPKFGRQQYCGSQRVVSTSTHRLLSE